MARVTNSPASRKRRKKVLKYAKGYFGNKSKLFRYAKEAVQHAWQYAYIDRKKKKANMRGLWIVRLNAACRSGPQLQPLHGRSQGGEDRTRSSPALRDRHRRSHRLQ